MKHSVSVAAIALVLGAAFPALAQQHAGHHPTVAEAATSASFTEGEVKKVDKEAGKLTIKHGPITNLDMPGMTMVFPVKDRAMLDKVKAGDAIRFKADKVEGSITVTEIVTAP